jgi:hypothetical protein
MEDPIVIEMSREELERWADSLGSAIGIFENRLPIREHDLRELRARLLKPDLEMWTGSLRDRFVDQEIGV